METAIFTSIVAGASALIGVALTSFIQMRIQRHTQNFQIELEKFKREIESQENEKKHMLERLSKVHRQLNTIEREFSLTSLVIIWQAEMSSSEYDQRYLSICEKIDELRATIDLYEPSLSEKVEKLYGQMNIFWGNFKNVLHLTTRDEKVDHMTPCFQKAHLAAEEIGQHTRSLKSQLSRLANMSCIIE